MNFEFKVNNIINNLNEPNLLSDLNCNVVLDISEPLMFVLNQLDEYYIAYVMQHKTMYYNSKKADVSELLISNSDFEEVKALLKGEISIKEALYKKDFTYKVGKIANKIYPPNIVTNVETIEDKIPKDSVLLDEKIPNKVILRDVLKKMEINNSVYNSYYLAPEKKLKELNFSLKSFDQQCVEWDYDVEIKENKVGIVDGD